MQVDVQQVLAVRDVLLRAAVISSSNHALWQPAEFDMGAAISAQVCGIIHIGGRLESE